MQTQFTEKRDGVCRPTWNLQSYSPF